MNSIKEMLRENRTRLVKLKKYAPLNPRIQGATDELEYQIKLMEYTLIHEQRELQVDDTLSPVEAEGSKHLLPKILSNPIFEDTVFNKIIPRMGKYGQ